MELQTKLSARCCFKGSRRCEMLITEPIFEQFFACLMSNLVMRQ
jgi:hypothetical protein